eukprot:CAMPEP_0171697152 /NCGR_PEP_ID=MMETSP0991-20121206/8665_1 /TAXON_ID=483369 /ORGANISM="non described non described, Strain CCMP2098" /LENGTH=89 /DNA_ID=CAMNT_0012285919 /DNA_START=180 /DNA_END=447 /DNA_ORIENTATION=+
MFCCAGRAGTASGVGGAGEATIAGVESGTAAGIAAEITALDHGQEKEGQQNRLKLTPQKRSKVKWQPCGAAVRDTDACKGSLLVLVHSS